jgi:hypothetical protein
MSGTITAKKVVTHPYFAMVFVLSLFFLVLPLYGGVAAMVGCAGILTVYVVVLPERFRSRSGSLKAATWLVAAMWVATAVITALTLMRD